MKTKPQIIQTLNGLLRHELTIINQYFLHARMYGHWGYEKLEKLVYKQSIRAMKNADLLIKRVFLLEGLPNLQDLGKLIIGEDVAEALMCDQKMTFNQLKDLKTAIAFFEKEEDFVSRDLAERLHEDVEEFYEWIGTELKIIEDIGIELYLQSLIK